MFPLKDTVTARSTPVVNYLIIGTNVAFFILAASLGDRGFLHLVRGLGVIPNRFLSSFGPAQLGTVFTSMFLHGGWFHLLSNMWALYIFGDNTEDRMGSARYLLFYLISGAVAALVHILVASGSTVPVVGASGAISGVMGAYILLFPTSRIITLVPIFFLPWLVEIPALVFIGMWFLSQLFSGILSLAADAVGAYGGVAWWAHVGGFLIGLILAKLFARKDYRRLYPHDLHWFR